MARLTVSHLTKCYRRNAPALEDVSFTLNGGEVLALLGENGAGKSTLIKCLVGLVPFDGDVTVGGVSVARHGRRTRALIGYLPQHPALHSDLSVAETAVFYADLRGVSHEEARERVASVGLVERADQPVATLSGGMRQRLALAIALLGDPPILIFDEPAAGLDIAARLELRALVQAQRDRGTAVLLSTHWLEDVPYVADRALVLDHGRQRFLGPADAIGGADGARARLFLRLQGAHVQAANIVRALLPATDVETSGGWLIVLCRPTEKARVVEALVNARVAILDLRVEEATMDVRRLDDAEPPIVEEAESCA